MGFGDTFQLVKCLLLELTPPNLCKINRAMECAPNANTEEIEWAYPFSSLASWPSFTDGL